jgi:hypothetical protein
VVESDSPTDPRRTIEDVADIASTRCNRRGIVARPGVRKPQAAGPHVELHRIVFAGRKTARATSFAEHSADARVG